MLIPMLFWCQAPLATIPIRGTCASCETGWMVAVIEAAALMVIWVFYLSDSHRYPIESDQEGANNHDPSD